jgi:hypothetical protein
MKGLTKYLSHVGHRTGALSRVRSGRDRLKIEWLIGILFLTQYLGYSSRTPAKEIPRKFFDLWSSRSSHRALKQHPDRAEEGVTEKVASGGVFQFRIFETAHHLEVIS